MDSLEDMEQFCKFQISPIRLPQHLGAGIHNIPQINPNSTGTRQQTACFDNENKKAVLAGKADNDKNPEIQRNIFNYMHAEVEPLLFKYFK